ncbi:response regulator [candidate division KSB3 bacterium]|uniref:Response regulator n=1 Tax=candidate division KSB3 bacterium TaxID=2044937 RepID=A0A9D5JY77_9BACT|nr:response regulator [candidate division KSB3 bacterium]MBD3326359.1 response regulator [candidate division KSB3 bacterium]
MSKTKENAPMHEKQPKILLVDDNRKNLDVLSEVLDNQFVLLFALDGVSGLQRAEAGQPDLILLDVMMPDLDGFETCRRLKASIHTAAIPVIFMTALSETPDKVKGFSLGAVDYITKPFQPEEVLARINTHLHIQRLQQELQVKNTTLKAKNEELEEKNLLLADRETHLKHLVEEKTHKIENITLALVNALEHANALNDDDTGRHIKRIGVYSAFLAELAGCDQDFVKRIKLYAPLHDVGKVGLPDTLLKKNGRYSPEEFIAMQNHVVLGASLLENEGIDLMARNIACYHHEKWDGSGYAEGLVGEAIPLEARIVALVDAYDALISKRVYKEAFSENRTDRIIRQDAGKHFDPHLVEIFLAHKPDIIAIRQSLT